MKYSRVHIEAMGYELPPVVVTSEELESRLGPMYEKLRISPGQLEALTGISERRWWEKDQSLTDGAIKAGRKALTKTGVKAQDIGVLIYAGVCREHFEPATACAVADALGISSDAHVFDISNACLGVLNGIIDIANRIELGQVRAGLVVSAETAREIVEVTIDRMLTRRTMDAYTKGLATLTGGSGAIAVLVTDGSFGGSERHALVGGAIRTAPEHHRLCRWGLGDAVTLHREEALPQDMYTDGAAVLKHGVELGRATWADFLPEVDWTASDVDRVITHQVGGPHRDAILAALDIPAEKDFSTYAHLGNIGTVSLPITAALAQEREVLLPGHRVAFLGIGSGLNCLMLGLEW